MKTYTFHVQGMHCNACTLMIESELGDIPNISHVKASLKHNSVEVTGNFDDMTEEQILEKLSKPLLGHGYKLSTERHKTSVSWSQFVIAVPVAVLFGMIFFLLQRAGLVNLIGGDGAVTYGTAFIIGIVASLSSCMAVVGGLLLSVSATFAKEGDTVRPQMLFHIGRIISFFILGGVVGAIGSAFTLNQSVSSLLSLVIGIVMLILGINLLDVFDITKKLQPSIPKFISEHALSISRANHSLTPLLFGIATFFLPCGFTQSMQLYALSTGSFLTGALTMLFFAFGTFPVLALLSFSSLSIGKGKHAGIFFKSAGLIVIMFAILNLIGGLIVMGAIPPILNF